MTLVEITGHYFAGMLLGVFGTLLIFMKAQDDDDEGGDV